VAEALTLTLDRLATPLGTLLVIADGEGRLRAVEWSDFEARLQRLLPRACGAQRHRLVPGRVAATAPLAAYFAGELRAIDAIPVAAAGTSFQQRVWRALREIPCGATLSYAALARRIGRPAAVRAVGLANGANPVGVVVPCHRVIGSDGTLTGYGGGLARKRWLLAHEAAHAQGGLRAGEPASSRPGSQRARGGEGD
jgi:methylated-DNA-[protein]-cysteine S-methyltransferase